MITLPHMLGAAPEYQNVIGLQPNIEEHIAFVDVEPVRDIYWYRLQR